MGRNAALHRAQRTWAASAALQPKTAFERPTCLSRQERRLSACSHWRDNCLLCGCLLWACASGQSVLLRRLGCSAGQLLRLRRAATAKRRAGDACDLARASQL
eukprot:3603634-Prymnesium_polylepis.4